MAKPSTTQMTDHKPQSEKFVETARALGCDEDEAAFKERLKKLVTAPAPKPAEKPKPKKPPK